MSIRKPYLSKLSYDPVPNSFHSFSAESTRVPATHSGMSPISSLQQTDALRNSSIEQLKPYLIEPRLHLELSTTVIDFHPVKVSKPEFALLTVQPDATVKSISIHSDRPELFQIASDQYPDYRANSRIEASNKITYIHIRYLSSQSFPKPQSALLFIQAESEIREVALIAHPTSRWTTLSRSYIGGSLLLISGLLFGVYTAYQHQCEWFPSFCQQKQVQVQPILTSVPNTLKTTLAEVEPKKLDTSEPSKKRKRSFLPKPSNTSRSVSSDEASSH